MFGWGSSEAQPQLNARLKDLRKEHIAVLRANRRSMSPLVFDSYVMNGGPYNFQRMEKYNRMPENKRYAKEKDNFDDFVALQESIRLQKDAGRTKINFPGLAPSDFSDDDMKRHLHWQNLISQNAAAHKTMSNSDKKARKNRAVSYTTNSYGRNINSQTGKQININTGRYIDNTAGIGIRLIEMPDGTWVKDPTDVKKSLLLSRGYPLSYKGKAIANAREKAVANSISGIPWWNLSARKRATMNAIAKFNKDQSAAAISSGSNVTTLSSRTSSFSDNSRPPTTLASIYLTAQPTPTPTTASPEFTPRHVPAMNPYEIATAQRIARQARDDSVIKDSTSGIPIWKRKERERARQQAYQTVLRMRRDNTIEQNKKDYNLYMQSPQSKLKNKNLTLIDYIARADKWRDADPQDMGHTHGI